MAVMGGQVSLHSHAFLVVGAPGLCNDPARSVSGECVFVCVQLAVYMLYV